MADQNKYHNGQKPLSGFQDTDSWQSNYDEIDLKQFLKTIWSSKWIILSSILVGGVLAFIIAFVQTPQYFGSGTMEIKQSQSSSSIAFNLGNSGLGSLLGGSLGGGANISNEMEVLKSRSLSEAMAKKLIAQPLMENGHMYPVLWRDWPEDSVIVSPGIIGARIRKNIEYNLLEGTTIVQIIYKSPSPLEAAHLVNLDMKTYKEQATEQSIELSGSTARFLSSEKAQLEDSLASVEQQLKRYMDRTGIIELDSQIPQQISQYADMTSQRYEAQVELEAVKASIAEYQQRLNNLKPGLADKLADAIGPKMGKLQSRISDLEARRALIYSNNPSLTESGRKPAEVKKIDSQVKSLKNGVKEEAKKILDSNDEFLGFLGDNSGSVISIITAYSQKLIDQRIEQVGYQAQVDILTKQINEKEAFLNDVPENMIQLTRLKRNEKIQEELYLLVTKQLAQTNITSKAEMGNSRPLDKATVPSGPSTPMTWLYILIGVFAGAVFAFTYIIIHNFFSTIIDHVSMLKYLNLKVLSVIPFLGIDRTRTQISAGARHTFFDMEPSELEAFRRLASSIIYNDSDNSLQSVMFTASKEGEGTTTVVGNLAIALTEANAKVVMIDMNFENADLKSRFEGSFEPQLAEVVLGNKKLNRAVQKTDIPGLDLLSSGDFNQPVGGGIQSANFKEILASLKSEYDYVLFDTPPLGSKSESIGLTWHADTTIVIVRSGETQKPELEFTLEQLAVVKAPVLGLVLNACKTN